MTTRPLNVLISEPQAHRKELYLPYVWAVLKTYCEREANLDNGLRWLDPIFLRDDAAVLLEPYAGHRIDVAGLSCYVWNWDLQCEIALRLKQRNPDCLVVAGGPHPDYKDPAFFNEHPYIDAVAVRDGEITFSRILERALGGRRDLSGIGGLFLRGGEGGCIGTGPADVPARFEHSPYLEQHGYYERWRRDLLRDAQLFATWETNRGCPYGCSFCDWGSNTMSKVRLFDIERIKAEIQWLAHMRVDSVILADANFGMPPRDVQIAQWLAESKARCGFPGHIYYSPAKNNPDRNVAVAKALFESRIAPAYVFAVQHTDLSVLAANERSNISPEKQREAARAIAELGMPTVVQLILGLPGDTTEGWRSCLTTLMEWGLHDNYEIFDYVLLPNAPAADGAFRERWQIQTVRRGMPKLGEGHRPVGDRDALTRLSIVVGCSTYSREDWVRMKADAAFVKALHNFGLTRAVAQYLRLSHGVPYREFYDLVIESHFARTRAARRLLQHLQAFLLHEDATEDLELVEFPEAGLYLEPGRWLFVQLCLELEEHFEAMARLLERRVPGVANLASILDYQRNLVVLPRPGQSGRKSFRTNLDWPDYFAQAAAGHVGPFPEPTSTPAAVVEATCAVTVWPDDPGEAWRHWIGLSAEQSRVITTVYSDPKLAAGVSAPCQPLAAASPESLVSSLGSSPR